MQMAGLDNGPQALRLIVVAFLVAATGPASAQRPPEEPVGELETWREGPERPTRVTVTFDTFRVSEKAGRLHIEFELQEESRELLEEHHIDLWMDAFVQPKKMSPGGFTATEALGKMDGSVTFPDWLDIPKDRHVKLCLMGTTPGDNLSLGRGYFCTVWSPWKAPKRGKSTGAIAIFTLQYRPGAMPYPEAPYHEPRTPSF